MLLTPSSQYANKTRDGLLPLEKIAFCGPACREGYTADRRYGIIYPSWLVEFDDGTKALLSHETAARVCHECCYCGAPL